MTTYREEFEEWLTTKTNYLPSGQMAQYMWLGFQACAELKDKEIEQLKARLAEQKRSEG